MFFVWLLISFLKQHLHAGMPESVDIEALKKEVDELKQKNMDLESQVSQLQAEVRLTRWTSVNYIIYISLCLSIQLSKYTETEVRF